MHSSVSVCRLIKATSPKLSVWAIVGLLLLLPIPVFVELVWSAHSYGLNNTFADVLCWVSHTYIYIAIYACRAIVYIYMYIHNTWAEEIA